MGDQERVNVDDIDEQEKPAEPRAAGAFEVSRIIKILLYIAGAILLIFIIIGISFLVAKYVQEQRYVRDQDIVLAPPPPPLAFYDMPSFSITTSDPDPHFAKITLAIGYEENVELATELIQRTPEMQHVINILMRDKSVEDLNSVEDMVNLSEEIKAHINVLLLRGKIKEIYFREFVVN